MVAPRCEISGLALRADVYRREYPRDATCLAVRTRGGAERGWRPAMVLIRSVSRGPGTAAVVVEFRMPLLEGAGWVAKRGAESAWTMILLDASLVIVSFFFGRIFL